MNRRAKLGPIVIALLIALCTGQVVFAQVDWTYGNPVVSPGPPGSWNEGRHLVGNVVFDGTDYHMYLIGGPGGNALDNQWSVGHWTWNDLTSEWDPDPCNPVLEPGVPGAWDSYTIASLAVLYDEGIFKMWYGAGSSYHGVGHTGYATNADGWCDWDKDPDNPVDGLNPGAPGAWNENGIGASTVLFDEGLFKMWWVTGSGDTWGGTWSIGYATSPDGLIWTPRPDPVLEATEPWEEDKVYFPEVIRIGDSFAMWYSGLNVISQLVEIGYSVSPDGLHWGKWSGNPVLSPVSPCNAVDSIAVLIEGDTVYAWVSHCDDIYHATSPFEVVFFDAFETGDTAIWSTVVP